MPGLRATACTRSCARSWTRHDGIDVFETAERLHVSTATLDADLARVRGLLGGTELTLERSASTRAAARDRDGPAAPAQQARPRRDGCRVVRPRGAAPHARRRIGRRARLRPVQDRPRRRARARSATSSTSSASRDVVMHIAIAADRVSRDRGLEGAAGEVRPRPAGGRARSSTASPTASPRRAARRGRPAAPRDARAHPRRRPRRLRAAPMTRGRAWSRRSRRRCARSSSTAAAEFLVDIAHEDFILRLALHVQNLLHRAKRAGVVAQPADAVAQVDVPDDLRGRRCTSRAGCSSVSASRSWTTRSRTSRCTSAGASSAAGGPTSC